MLRGVVEKTVDADVSVRWIGKSGQEIALELRLEREVVEHESGAERQRARRLVRAGGSVAGDRDRASAVLRRIAPRGQLGRILRIRALIGIRLIDLRELVAVPGNHPAIRSVREHERGIT